MQKILLPVFISCFMVFVTFCKPVLATNIDNSPDIVHNFVVAHIIDANDKDIKDGSIVSFSKKSIVLSNVAYDLHVLGVVSRNVPVTLYTNNRQLGKPVIVDGTAYVLVSNANGVIKKDDKIATSTMPGVGVKAVESGYIIGTALEGYNDLNPKHTGKILVSLTLNSFNFIQPFPQFLLNIITFFNLPAQNSPFLLIGYILAVGMSFVLLILAFVTFGRTGLKVLSTNPAGWRSIHLGIIINITVIFVIILLALTAALLLIKL